MWIVRLALNRTYTFIVVAVLIAVLGAVSIYRLSTDVFPEHRHSGCQRRVVLHGHARRRRGNAHRVHQ